MKGSGWFLLGVIVGAFALAICLDYDKAVAPQQPQIKVEERLRVDTIRDTIKIPEPQLVERLKVRTDTVRLPMVAEAMDSVAVQLPIEQRVYADSTYKAWVSGCNPSLDSIHVYPTNTVITIHTTETQYKYRDKRWGFGVTAGLGFTPQNIQPYIGVGISYNILNW